MKLRHFLILIICGVLYSCSSAAPIKDTTIIRDTTIKIAPPLIVDSSKAKVEYLASNAQDSVFRVLRTAQRDTIVDIRFVPKTQYLYWKIKPDTIQFTKRDTLKLIEYKIEKTNKLEKFGLFSFGAVATALTGTAFYFFQRYKR